MGPPRSGCRRGLHLPTPQSGHRRGPPWKWTWKGPPPPEVDMEEDPPPKVDTEEDPPPEVDTEEDPPPLEVDAEEVVEEDQLKSTAGQVGGMP